MKRIFLFFLACSFIACSKKDPIIPVTVVTPPTVIPPVVVIPPIVTATVVTYKFTSSQSDTFILVYQNGDGSVVNLSFTGTSWTKSITPQVIHGFAGVAFGVGALSAKASDTVTLTILVNGIVGASTTVTFDSNTQSAEIVSGF